MFKQEESTIGGIEKIVYIPESELFCLPMFHAAAVEDYPDYFEGVVERWKPEEDDTVWYVLSDGGITTARHTTRSQIDRQRYNFGSMFRTKAQATEAAKRIKKTLTDYHRELSEKGE